MVVKWPLITIIGQGPISRRIINIKLFYGSQKEYDRQKVARVKRPGETNGKGLERNLGRQWQKKNYTFVPNLELKLSLSSEKLLC